MLTRPLNVVVQFNHCAQLGPAALAPFKYADPVPLNNLLIDFPDLKIVVEHLNYPWYEELFFMIASDPNVYADIAMMYDRPRILTWNLVRAKEFGVIDRIMYASDYWAAGQGGILEEWRRGHEKVDLLCQNRFK